MPADFTPQTKAADAPDIEAGWYDLRFTGTEGKTIKGGKYQKNPEGDPKLVWFFTALDDEGDDLYADGELVKLDKLTGVTFNPTAATESAQLAILRALMTNEERKLYDDEGIAPKEADLLGRVVQGKVFVREDGWPGIADVLAPRSKRSSKAKAKAAPDASIDEE